MTTGGKAFYRRPTDEEQQIIADLSFVRSRLIDKGFDIAGTGMGADLIEDLERGRWTHVFGQPVSETRIEAEPDGLYVLVRVPRALAR